ncbi:MAG: hydroxyphenylacetyl-CoA thioesterase PaaI [Hyphomicrobiales bacterium]|nr:hydroxyphenylacetyl-CoA thioesterase PaaI [Hyphomicrobiales bacterium]
MDDLEQRHALAQRAARAMWSRDHAARHLGIDISRVAPGEAVLTMSVTAIMLNGHDICHGGYIFTLADTAFAYACNSAGETTVAMQAEVHFLKPGRLGDVLRATASHSAGEGRSGIYDVVVERDGEVLAMFRGLSRRIGGSFLGEGT